jgi:hypothetical protein
VKVQSVNEQKKCISIAAVLSILLAPNTIGTSGYSSVLCRADGETQDLPASCKDDLARTHSGIFSLSKV